MSESTHRVVIVGAGFSGIGMAIRLREMGLDDFVVLDRGNDLGGTWRDNSYPGAACDVPSNLYSFSFALNPGWTRSFPSQREIWDYMRDCVDRFDVGKFLRFNHDIAEARWDDVDNVWRVRSQQGQTYVAPVLIWATGSLSAPSIPDFPGLGEFRGKVFHSAQWEHGFELAGKRVCVVGTGASAIQFVPQIQPVVAHLTLYQRTAPWVFPRRDKPVSKLRQELYRRLPLLQRVARLRIYLIFEFLLSVFMGQAQRRKGAVKKRAGDHLHKQVADESLRVMLKPHYEVGCKRLLLSDDYYPSLTQPNVEVLDVPVVSFTAHEVVGEDGVARPVDVVIMGTGFEAAEPPYAQHIVGRDGVRLSDVWKRDGVAAYAGSTVAGFPNLFMMIGPNATLAHNSMIYMIESHINYIASALRFMARPGVGVVEVKPAVQERYNEMLQAKLEHSVWVEGGCGSWYLDHRGRNTTLWPDHTWKFRALTKRFRPGDYTVRAADDQRARASA
ncbi:MAG TPA: NAD(P)/FAD-dependent oxidoreductase [Acidimicrobiales bacterium]|nr:NAD(P)/FAD-dependent oxidoreductase [Acidimicrobiales bacterium]